MSWLLRSPWCRFGIAFVALITSALALAALDRTSAAADASEHQATASAGCAVPEEPTASGTQRQPVEALAHDRRSGSDGDALAAATSAR